MLDPECFEYRREFLPRTEADRLLESLWRAISWSQQEIMLFNRRVLQPRLTAWYGDPGASYSYSGIALDPLPWLPRLSELRSRLERDSGRRFNAVLANAYRDGRDSMGWHSDDEPELGPAPFIASVSLGAERRLLIRRRPGRGRRPGPSMPLILEHGSVLFMKGPSQRLYQHSLPKTARASALRINLTFRLISRDDQRLSR